MKKCLLAAGALACLPPLAHAQYGQASKQYSFNLKGDGLARQEWTRDLFGGGQDSRWRVQARPRVEIGISGLLVGVGGDFNYSQDQNTKPPAGVDSLLLLRDNYKSRDARLDLAIVSLKLD